MSDRETAPSEESWTVLAHLLRPQGRKGEILAELLTDFPARFSDRDELYLAGANFSGPASDARAVEILGHWLPVGRNQGRVVLHLAGVETIEQAEALGGLEIIVPTAKRMELDADEEYVDDLVGCIVYDDQVAVGSVVDVSFPLSPDGARRLEGAAPLLSVLTDAGEEVLIPYVQSFLVSVDAAAKRIEMRLPSGLVDLNRAK